MSARQSIPRWRPVAGVVLALIGFAIPVMIGCHAGRQGADIPAGTPEHQVGPFRISAENVPAPPRIGDNQILVRLRDTHDEPVRDAAVEIRVSMPAMGSMPSMESRGKVKAVKPGLFSAEYGLAMNGEWDVTVRIRPKHGEPIEAAYRLSTSTRELGFAGGTPAEGMTGAGAMPGMSHEPVPPVSGPGGGASGIVTVDPARRQSLGIRTEPVQVRELSSRLRTAGRVAYDEKRQTEVALKFSGFVRDIRVDYTGRPVRKGEVLLTAYSPELWSAQKEYIEAQRTEKSAGAGTVAVEPATELAEAARQRLLLWDIPASELDRIAREGKPREAMPILCPASGVVTEKSVVKGSAFSAGQILYKIASTNPVWVVASVYQVDLPLVRLGMPATLLNPYLDQRSRHGRVSFIFPTLQSETRTGEVRIEVLNPHDDLKPGMFVDVELELPLGKRLAVPESAVLPTGERKLVFVDVGQGRLAPREVRLGHRAGGYYEVLDGLREGEAVVTSGNFLVAAESKLRSATEKW